MKKIVHATQMFALIAMFPVIVILDLNRTTPTSCENDSPLNVTQKKMVQTILQETAEEKALTGSFSIRLVTLVINKEF